MTQIKRFLVPFLALLLVSPLLTSSLAQAAVVANYSSTDAPALTVGKSASNILVLDINVPDAWNSGLFTADILQKAGSAFVAQGQSLTAFTNPALNTLNGVGYIEDATAGFQGTEPVIIDVDGDDVYTAQPDILIDGDGSPLVGGTDGVGTVDGSLVNGAPLQRFNAGSQPTGKALCTNSLTAPTAIRIDTDTNCNNLLKTEGDFILGSALTLPVANIKANNTWVFADTGATAGSYDDGEDIFRDGQTPARQTYSEFADTNTYGTTLPAPVLPATSIHGVALQNFQADCDGAGIGSRRCRFTGGTFSSASSILVDEGSKAGGAPNNIVDKQADQLIGLGVQNMGTAVKTTDIASLNVWMESGVTAGFQAGEDTLLSAMTAHSTLNNEWFVGGLSAPIPANGARFYVTANTSATATNGATMQFRLGQFNDAGADGFATADGDLGAFVASDNDGPTDGTITNTSVQTIDALAPALTEVTPVPTPSNNRTPDFTFNTDEAGTISYPGSCSSATTAATVGNNTITLNSLSDGIFNLCQIRVTDAFGNFSTLTATTFTVDGTAPTLTPVTLVPTPSTDTTPSYEFNTDEAGTIAYGGGCTSATTAATTVPNNVITFDALLDGTYNCTITVTDALGNISAPLAVNAFVIDTTGPTAAEFLAITSPTNDNTPAYTFTSNEAGTIAYAGGCTSATTAAVNGNNPIVFNALADGTYSLCTIQVTDALGNAGNVLAVSVFTVDTTGVILTEFAPIASPISDSTPAYTFVSDSAGTITFGGSCTAISFTVAVVGNNPITFDALADGTYSDCTVMVTDAALNPSNTLAVSTFTVDTTAPNLAEVTPVPVDTNVTTPSYTFSSDEAGSITYGGDCSSATTVAASSNNTVVFNALAEGLHNNCTITVTDTAGNTSSVLNVSAFTVDITPPVVAEVTPVPALTNDNTPDYTFSSTEAGTISYGGTCSSGSTGAGAGNNTVTFTTLADGTHDACTVQVTDAAGNNSNVQDVTDFVVDTTLPVLAEVTPVANVTYDVTPNYTFSTTEAGTIGYTGPCTSTTTVAVVGNNTITFDPLPLDTYDTCGITVTDAATNTSTVLTISTFVVSSRNRTAPAIEVTGVANPSSVPVGGTIALTFTAINRGDVAMNNIVVTSDFCATPTLVSGDTNSDANLDVSESWVFACSVVATEPKQGTVTMQAIYNGVTMSDSVIITISTTPNNGGGGNGGTEEEILFCSIEAAALGACVIDENDGTEIPVIQEEQTSIELETATQKLELMGLVAHDLIKAEDTKAVYYVGPDARKHLFISANIFFTWYCSFDGLKTLSKDALNSIEHGTAVTYRPGVRMIKLADDNKVYAIEKGHTLRWITTEDLAVALYGTNWNTKIDDVADFDGYTMGADITSVAEYAPTLAEQSVTLPADAMDPILGYIPSPMGEGLSC